MASAAMSVVRALPRETRQAWILSPAQDTLFVVAAPLLVLAAAVAAFAFLGAVDATAYILLLHVVLTVAHHLPTFIRVYGDVDLFRRFKWTFVLAPVIPARLRLGGARLLEHARLPRRERPVLCGCCLRSGIRGTS